MSLADKFTLSQDMEFGYSPAQIKPDQGLPSGWELEVSKIPVVKDVFNGARTAAEVLGLGIITHHLLPSERAAYASMNTLEKRLIDLADATLIGAWAAPLSGKANRLLRGVTGREATASGISAGRHLMNQAYHSQVYAERFQAKAAGALLEPLTPQGNIDLGTTAARVTEDVVDNLPNLSLPDFSLPAAAQALVSRTLLEAARPAPPTLAATTQEQLKKGFIKGTIESTEEEKTRLLATIADNARVGLYDIEKATVAHVASKGLKKSEYNIVMKHLRDEDTTDDLVAHLTRTTKDGKPKSSRAFRELLQETPEGNLSLPGREALRESLELRPETIYANWKARQYRQTFFSEFRTRAVGAQRKTLPEAAFQQQVAKRFPLEAMSWQTAVEKDYVNEMMAAIPKDRREIAKIFQAKPWGFLPKWMTPNRFILGEHEQTFGLFTKGYRLLRDTVLASRGSDKAYFEVFTQMANQERFLLDGVEHPLVETNIFKDFKWGKGVGKSLKLAQEYLTEVDNLSQHLRDTAEVGLVDDFMQEIESSTMERIALLNEELQTKSPQAAAVVRVWRRFSDRLYSDMLIHETNKRIQSSGLTDTGRSLLTELNADLLDISARVINDPLASTLEKQATIKEHLDLLRGHALGVPSREIEMQGLRTGFFKNDIFKGTSLKEITENTAVFEKSFTLGPEDFPEFLDNYTARVGRDTRKINNRLENLVYGPNKAPHQMGRVLTEDEAPPLSFSDMLYKRIHAIGKNEYINPAIKELTETAHGLPQQLALVIDYSVGRAIGRPTIADMQVSEWLSKTVGSAERLFGQSGEWTPTRLRDLSSTISNVIMSSAIGFRPFTALRDTVSPFLIGPTDLGIKTFTKDGLKLVHNATAMSFNPEFRSYINRIGGITDILEEVTAQTHRIKPTVEVAGYTVPSSQSVVDTSLWLYQRADRLTRYITGGMASLKWDSAIQKAALVDDLSTRWTFFYDEANLGTRGKAISSTIRTLLESNRLDEAKDVFVRNAIHDNMFLYGGIDSPSMMGAGGAVGRQATMFQSWWMNYASRLERWMITGTHGFENAKGQPWTQTAKDVLSSERTGRGLNWLVSSALLYELTSQVWPTKHQERTVGFGPIPFVGNPMSEFMIPPVFQGLYYGVLRPLSLISPNTTQEDVSRVIKDLSRPMTLAIPGGVQLKTTMNAYEKGGIDNAAASIFGMSSLSEEPSSEGGFMDLLSPTE